MRYEHVLGLELSPEELAALDRFTALSRARRLFRGHGDIQLLAIRTYRTPNPQVYVTVVLPHQDPIDDSVAGLLRSALGLAADVSRPFRIARHPVPLSEADDADDADDGLLSAPPPGLPAAPGAPPPPHMFRRIGPGEDEWPVAGGSRGSGTRSYGDGSAAPRATEVPPDRRRYLLGQCPDTVRVGEPFSLLVRITMAEGSGAGLKPFGVPPGGLDVLIVIHAPGLRILGSQRYSLRVPPGGDSEPVKFELRPEEPGPRQVSVTAWHGGSYLGELLVDVTAERDGPASWPTDTRGELSTATVDGAVSLVVRYEPQQGTYRFEFRDVDNPDEITSSLAYDPGPRVERLVRGLDDLARGRTGYSPAEARDYLRNAGAGLWRDLVPERLREQFWERQHRIRQLTILTDRDAVPWELLYPLDRGHDAGFLVEQFPVTRDVFRRPPLARRLLLRPALFVLPENSPASADGEVEALRRLLGAAQSPEMVISALTPLLGRVNQGDFGLLHFACHNRFDPADGSSITLDSRPFTPILMTAAGINQTLAATAPLVFINACRSGGMAATYNRLDGWADAFIRAGAAAFIGSLWAVSDEAAREFAEELYRQLQAGIPLGDAVMTARRTAAGQAGDPTWLAYTVYGDPRARVG